MAYLLLIQERRLQAAAGEGFDEFARRNRDLMRWRPSVLARYYREETLASERARRGFVFPDRGLARGPELEHEPRGPHREGGGQEQVGEGDEKGQEAGQAEAEALRGP